MVKPRTRHAASLLFLPFFLALVSCHGSRNDPQTIVVALENSPSSLDPRVGTDAASERIDQLLFDSLVHKDAHYRMVPWLAERWEQPDPLTWIFHLRDGVHFADGRRLGASDVAWTIDSMRTGTGGLITSKGGAFAGISRIDIIDRLTLRLTLKKPDASLLFNLSDGLFGVVPEGANKDFARTPIGSGPFKFVSAETDKQVLLEANATYWAGPPHLTRVQFAVVPDAVTVALELQKGSADIASNEVTLDLVHALQKNKALRVETGESSRVMYLNFNCARGPLADARVRQAIAFAIDRQPIVDAVWRGQATLANTLLPAGHWAAADLTGYPHDPAKARALLDAAGYRPRKNGIRLQLEMKTSQDETTRLLAAILQQQLADAGIALTLRAAEFGTFYSDVTAGRFEMYALNWVGSNEDPDIFRYAYASDQAPPKGGNRGRYSNPRVDALLNAAAATGDEPTRRAAYIEVEQILLAEVPSIVLWHPRNEIVHNARVVGIVPPASGDFGFLVTASAH